MTVASRGFMKAFKECERSVKINFLSSFSLYVGNRDRKD